MIFMAMLGLAATAPEARPISDRALRAYARQPFDAAAMAFKSVALGRNHGAAVVADFPCSDVCPGDTRRIIHYLAAPGAACRRIGGVTETILVPMSIAVVRKAFCVPRAIAGFQH